MSRKNLNHPVKVSDDSPSFQRRQALRQADAGNVVRVLDSYPLSKYFDISERLLDAFQKAVDGRRLDEAYVYGLRFAAFGVESLPKHRSWRKATHTKQKHRNAQQAEKVISMMEIIKQRMDAEEMILQEQRRVAEEQRLKEESARKKQRDLEEKQAREERRKLEETRLKHEGKKCSKNVEQSAMAKLYEMQSKLLAPEKTSLQPQVTDLDEKTPTVSDQAPSSRKKGKTKKPKKQQPSEEKKIDLPSSESSQNEPPKAVERSAKQAVDTKAVERSAKQAVETKAVERSAKQAVETNDPASPPSKSPNTLPRKMTPLSSKEQRTIDLLQATIHAQEKRLEEIDTTQIPALVRLAKEFLQKDEANRRAAVKCVARKRLLERQMDAIKAAIFNMETQMFMLENAMEDRQVQKALDEASHTMKGLQQSVGDGDAVSMDLTDLTVSLPPSMMSEQDEDDEELFEELQDWLTPGQKKMQREEDDVSILSMPNVPASLAESLSVAAEETEADALAVGKMLKAVLG